MRVTKHPPFHRRLLQGPPPSRTCGLRIQLVSASRSFCATGRIGTLGLMPSKALHNNKTQHVTYAFCNKHQRPTSQCPGPAHTNETRCVECLGASDAKAKLCPECADRAFSGATA